MPTPPRPSWVAGVLACAVVAVGGCGGGDGGASRDKAAGTAAPTASSQTSTAQQGGPRRFRLEASRRCKTARRAVRLPRALPSGPRLKGYVARARRRDRALLGAISSVRPPDDEIAAQVEALKGAYATLLPLYDRVRVADEGFALTRLRNGLRATERAVSGVAASMGIAACGPSPP